VSGAILQWLPVHGFAKAHGVAAGGSATVTLAITARDLSRWDDATQSFTVRPGTYGLQIRDDSSLGATLTVTA
jgi:hypothetical protein